MQEKRVVITGVGVISAFGRSWADVKTHFQAKKNAVRVFDDWNRFADLESKLAAPVPNYQPPKHWTRKQLRSMGTVAQYAVDAAEQALTDAGLINDPIIKTGLMGTACGSSVGSTQDVLDSGLLLAGYESNFNANTYVRMMPHSSVANVAIFFGLTGRIIPTSSACTSGSQAIGYSYEAIKYGKIPMMLAGGTEQLCPSEVFVFDSLYAASRKNDAPQTTPRPYDKDRDGLVIGEGACMMVLEELEHAKARGANILAEIVGYGANSDGSLITRPNQETMQRCMLLALEDANLPHTAIGYID
ncbi:MAG: beta-ketoacyl-ACP synthase, partial [Neisseriaceae bacterium]|nr:beta-ketoacyl-ACP synthase [Neisseriaceae bacterium]